MVDHWLSMDGIQIFGIVVFITGIAAILANTVGVIIALAFIPTNVFIIGLGLAVIGLVLIWNQVGDLKPGST
jgi:hypothetical protein